ncbi:MAG TPA: restriction endonuclease subunit S [Bacteroidales bacterium]|nr:restriction endonuclease subunit S [Bacteroidales bacterium]
MNKDKKLIPELRFPEFLNDEEWAEKLIGDITISESSSMALNKLELKPKGYPVYGADSIAGYIDDFQQEEKYISIVKDGSGVGRLNLCQSHSSILGTLVCLKSKNKKLYHLDWIYYLLNTVDFSVYVKGAGIPHIYFSDFKFEKISVPKPKEQQKIASCLSSLDEVISAHNHKLELLNDHKKGLMQNLFPQEGEKVPKFRFMEFEKDGKWVEKSLIDTANKKVKWSFTGGPFGSNLKASDYTADGFRIIQLQNIGDGEFNNEYKIYTSKEKADELLSCNIYAGEIIISKMGDPVGRACIIPDYLKKCVMASDGIRLVVDESKYSKYFIYSLINSKRIREAIEKKATGSTRKRIGLDELKGIELMIPKKIEEQKKIASCLSSLDELIKGQSEKLEQLKLHKKGLMQGLFPKIKG